MSKIFGPDALPLSYSAMVGGAAVI